MEDAVITSGDDDLDGFTNPDERPPRPVRWFWWLLRPLVPLANRALIHKAEEEAARHHRERADDKRKLHRAKEEADAAKEELKILAAMYARVQARVLADTAIFNAQAKRAAES